MSVRHIQQAISADSLYRVLTAWCELGAGRDGERMCILSAFVSGAAVKHIEPYINRFLAQGNVVELIFGVDEGGTDRAAVRSLLALSRRWGEQFEAWRFSTGTGLSLYHPKLYLYEEGRRLRAAFGSANLTARGLAYNLESLIEYEGPRTTQLAQALLSIWDSFRNPAPPLGPTALEQLTAESAQRIMADLPDELAESRLARRRSHRGSWQPRSRLPRRPGVSVPVPHIGSFMIMEILSETRGTQVQFPRPIIERFFQIHPSDTARADIVVLAGGQVISRDHRTVVLSGADDEHRVMRRIEMPEIEGLDRPMVALFIRMPGELAFAVQLIRRDSPAFALVDELLDRHDQGGPQIQRRYYIGPVREADPVWSRVESLLR